MGRVVVGMMDGYEATLRRRVPAPLVSAYACAGKATTSEPIRRQITCPRSAHFDRTGGTITPLLNWRTHLDAQVKRQ